MRAVIEKISPFDDEEKHVLCFGKKFVTLYSSLAKVAQTITLPREQLIVPAQYSHHHEI